MLSSGGKAGPEFPQVLAPWGTSGVTPFHPDPLPRERRGPQPLPPLHSQEGAGRGSAGSGPAGRGTAVLRAVGRSHPPPHLPTSPCLPGSSLQAIGLLRRAQSGLCSCCSVCQDFLPPTGTSQQPFKEGNRNVLGVGGISPLSCLPDLGLERSQRVKAAPCPRNSSVCPSP